jgi:outer membrane protein
MRHLSSLFGFGVVCLFAAAGAAPAQTPAAAPASATAYPALAAPTIAVVDFQRVLRESAAGRSIMSQLDGEQRKLRDQVSRMQEEVRTAENELKRKLAVMAPDQATAERDGLQRKEAEYQRILQDKQEAMQRGEQEAGLVVNDNMRDIVQQYAAERRIGVVLQKQAVISMADKNMDITDEVIQRLNAKLPSVTVNVTPTAGAQTASQSEPASGATAPAAKPSGKK